MQPDRSGETSTDCWQLPTPTSAAASVPAAFLRRLRGRLSVAVAPFRSAGCQHTQTSLAVQQVLVRSTALLHHTLRALLAGDVAASEDFRGLVATERLSPAAPLKKVAMFLWPFCDKHVPHSNIVWADRCLKQTDTSRSLPASLFLRLESFLAACYEGPVPKSHVDRLELLLAARKTAAYHRVCKTADGALQS